MPADRSGKITLQDIAARAGVGAGTVSRVLNDHPNVSQATRARVLQVIDTLGYRRNFSARQMRTGKAQAIGFVTDEIASTQFAVNIIKGAQSAAWQYGKLLIVVNSDRTPEIEIKGIERLLERGVDGIIYASMFHREAYLPAMIYEAPAVLIDCFVADRSLPSVVPDEYGAACEATEILIRKGHRRIGLINLGGNARPAIEGRLAGYTAALQAHNLFDPELIVHGGLEGEGRHGYAAAMTLMQRPDRPTALFCAQDRIAVHTYRALRDLGLSIPSDVAVMGFDDHIDVATALMPQLSTMALPHLAMGRWAVEHLLNGADLALEPVQMTLPCPYVERESI